MKTIFVRSMAGTAVAISLVMTTQAQRQSRGGLAPDGPRQRAAASHRLAPDRDTDERLNVDLDLTDDGAYMVRYGFEGHRDDTPNAIKHEHSLYVAVDPKAGTYRAFKVAGPQAIAADPRIQAYRRKHGEVELRRPARPVAKADGAWSPVGALMHLARMLPTMRFLFGPQREPSHASHPSLSRANDARIRLRSTPPAYSTGGGGQYDYEYGFHCWGYSYSYLEGLDPLNYMLTGSSSQAGYDVYYNSSVGYYGEVPYAYSVAEPLNPTALNTHWYMGAAYIIDSTWGLGAHGFLDAIMWNTDFYSTILAPWFNWIGGSDLYTQVEHYNEAYNDWNGGYYYGVAGYKAYGYSSFIHFYGYGLAVADCRDDPY